MTPKEFFESKGYKQGNICGEDVLPFSLALKLMEEYNAYLLDEASKEGLVSEIENIIDYAVELETVQYSEDEDGNNPSYTKETKSIKKAAVEILKLFKK